MKSNRPQGVKESHVRLLLSKDKDPALAAVRIICEGYCEYFKGDGGEKECRGFMVALHGLESKTIGTTHIETLVGKVPGQARRDGRITEALCANCGYRKDGCDFQSSSPLEEATPCGGYRLIQALLDSGSVTRDDLKKLFRSTGIQRSAWSVLST
jgi:hypothetical protein